MENLLASQFGQFRFDESATQAQEALVQNALKQRLAQIQNFRPPNAEK